MKLLLQRVAVFLRHIIESECSPPDTIETAIELEVDVDDAINGNYQEEDEKNSELDN